MGVILQVALPSRVLAAARLQCGAAGAGASRGLGVCAEHARLAARGESARAMEIGDFLGRLGPGRFSQCELETDVLEAQLSRHLSWAGTTLSDSERSFAAGLAHPGECIDAGGRSPHASVQGCEKLRTA